MLIKTSFLILFLGMCLAPISFAAVSLSVNPADGSNSLRFEKMPAAGAENKVEIHIRVSSTDTSRFQVFQRILEPMVNEKGDTLNLQAVSTQTLPNSNSSGTLYLQNADHLSMGDQLLYSSSESGTGDSFVIGYSLDQSLINTGGSFRGRIVFTVRGMNNASSDQVTLDVFLETSPALKISVKGARNPGRIRIKGSDISEKTADFINISFSGNSGQEVKVYQEVESLPQNETGHELGSDVIQLDAEGPAEGLRAGGISALRATRSLIYSGTGLSDNFLIYFLVDADQVLRQDAGSYLGRIKYIVETDHSTQEFPIDIQCDILPIFSMNVTKPIGGVRFLHVLSIDPPQYKEILVTVFSNLHQPYQVFQDFKTGLTNTQGKEFDNTYFNVQVQIPSGQKGQTDLAEFTPVQTGEYPVFSSDAQGSSTILKVVYRLQGYTQMSPGDYFAPVTISLNQK